MFRKLLGIAVATAAMTTLLGGMTAVPAQAASADAVIHIGYAEVPVTGGAYSLDGSGDLVGSLTRTGSISTASGTLRIKIDCWWVRDSDGRIVGVDCAVSVRF